MRKVEGDHVCGVYPIPCYVPYDERAFAEHLQQGDFTQRGGGDTLFLHLCVLGGSLSEKMRSPLVVVAEDLAKSVSVGSGVPSCASSAMLGSWKLINKTYLKPGLLQRHEPSRVPLPRLVHLAVGALPNLLQLFIRLVDGVPHPDVCRLVNLP